jgi:Holliday junction resolvase
MSGKNGAKKATKGTVRKKSAEARNLSVFPTNVAKLDKMELVHLAFKPEGMAAEVIQALRRHGVEAREARKRVDECVQQQTAQKAVRKRKTKWSVEVNYPRRLKQLVPYGSRYESLAKSMLEKVGFQNVRRAPAATGYDFDADKDGENYAIEVKGTGISAYYTPLQLRWKDLQHLSRAHRLGKQPLLVTINSESRGIFWKPTHIDMVDDQWQRVILKESTRVKMTHGTTVVHGKRVRGAH